MVQKSNMPEAEMLSVKEAKSLIDARVAEYINVPMDDFDDHVFQQAVSLLVNLLPLNEQWQNSIAHDIAKLCGLAYRMGYVEGDAGPENMDDESEDLL